MIYRHSLRFSVFNTFATTILALATITANASTQKITKFPTTTLTAGMHVIHAEVATSKEEQEQGLMFRKKMGTNEGMVFIFKAPAKVCMWMKDTALPLSVAFIKQDGEIVNIEDMAPQTTDAHCSKKPIRYALEMNQGWFKQRNIKPGNTIYGLTSPAKS